MSGNQPLILAIDGGSQSTKVSIYDLAGNVVCEASRKLKPMHLAPGGVVEHPDDDLWTSLEEACQALWERFTGDVNDIVGVGLCTIRFCRALLKADGHLAQPVLSWMDLRVSSPYEHTNPEVAWVTTSSGYITQRLTGEFRDTAANYAGQWPIDPHTWDWSTQPEVWQVHRGLDVSMLFELIQPGEVAGRITAEASQLTGIPEGLAVVVSANDKAVEGLGGGLVETSEALVSLGTYITGMMLGQEYEEAPKSYWTNYASLPNKYLYESGGIRRGMWTVSWLMDLVGPEFAEAARREGRLPEEKLEQEARLVPPGSDGMLVALDFLAPADQPHIKGTIFGLDARHTRGHMYRAIIESIAMTMTAHVRNMANERGSSFERVILSGGGANSDLMCQVFADCFNLPVIRNQNAGGAGTGCAMLVALALDYFPDVKSASEVFVARSEEFLPSEEHHELYEQLISGVEQQLTATTEPIYRKTFPIFG